MKTLQSNQINNLLFPLNGQDISNLTSARFRQLGDSRITIIPISVISEDCFTCTISINIASPLRNGLHLLEILDSGDNTIITSTVKVEGSVGVDNYFIYDDDRIIYANLEPVTTITFSSTDFTWSSTSIKFSNNNNL